MSAIEDLYDAISIFSSPITVHPTINMLDDDNTNEYGEDRIITKELLANDNDAEKLDDPVVPKTSNISNSMAQSLNGGGNTQPIEFAWYSEHAYRVGAIVEYNHHVYQIDQVGDFDAVASIYVYYLRGDEALASLG